MRYPDPLPPHGTIGFIAPSFGCTTEPYRSLFEMVRRQFQAEGYRIIAGPNCLADAGIGKSNTPEACGAEINTFFTADDCDVILSCGGGETMCEDLSYVDFRSIADARPRWYMGYSDNTCLTFTLPTLCDTAAIYGPNAPEFGTRPRHPAVQDAFDLLTGQKTAFSNYDGWELQKLKGPDNPYAPYHITEPFAMEVFRSGANDPADAGTVTCSGRLLGGCLDVLQCLAGTPYDRVKDFGSRYAADGVLWFLEACDLSPMGVRRAVWQLDQAGWFRHASGFLIGRSLHYGETCMGMDMYNAYTGVLGKYHVPILMDLDFGHLPPQIPLITGAYARASAVQDHFSIRMELR